MFIYLSNELIQEGNLLLKGETNRYLLENDEKLSLEGAVPYEIIDHSGDLRSHGFFVFNNIPVTEEGRPIFEERFLNRARAIEDEPGFLAIRVMRPLTSNTYIILTQWDDETSFTNWQSSQAYAKAHQKRGTSEGIDKRPAIFDGPSFVTTYNV